MAERGVRRSTAEQYVKGVRRVAGQVGASLTDFSWLYDMSVLDDVSRSVRSMSVSSRLGTYIALLVVMTVLYGEGKETEAARTFYDGNIRELNAEKRDVDRTQTLAGREEQRWKSVEQLEANMDRLFTLSREAPLDATRHFRYLIYALYIYMKEVCAFRLDVVYSLRFTAFDSYQNRAYNCIVLPSDGVSTGTLIMNDYKTSKSHGTVKLTLPSSLVSILSDSLTRFPRTWFVPSTRDFSTPLHSSHASRFVKQAWVLDSTDGPTADDVRSAITTKFFAEHPGLIERDVFAFRSMSSRDTMERCYYKIANR